MNTENQNYLLSSPSASIIHSLHRSLDSFYILRPNSVRSFVSLQVCIKLWAE